MPETDYDEIVAQFDEGYEIEEPEVEDETVLDDEEVVDEQEEENVEEEQDEEQHQETETNPDFQNDKQNQAFAELRRKAQENEKYAALVQRMAEQAGTDPDEIVKRFEERALELEAQNQGVPVEVVQRLKTLEEENKTVKEAAIAEKLDKQIQQTIKEYGATDDEIKATFEEMFRSGVDPRTNPNADFEKFYKAAHLDKILEQKVNEAKQTSLSQKKKRQSQAAIPNGTGTSQQGSSDIDDLVKQDVNSILDNW